MTSSNLTQIPTYNPTLCQELKSRLDRFEPQEEPPGDARLAAVALAVVPDKGGAASVLITRRGSALRHHRGQFALPGGRVDPGRLSPKPPCGNSKKRWGSICRRALCSDVSTTIPPAQVL